MSDTDPQGAQLGRLLADLANDPAAPPSTVDALSVIRAAKAAADGSPDRSAGDDPAVPQAAAASAADDLPSAEVIPFRPSRRRRRALPALVAAAALVAVAALVVPLSLSGGSVTSTSADAERAVAQSAAADAAAGLESAAPSPAAAAPDLGISSPAGAAGAGAPETSAAAGPGPAESAPVDGFVTGAGCWPALSGPVAKALDAALPPGAFADQLPLHYACSGVPVGGALLPGSSAAADANATSAAADAPEAAAGTAMVVRISRAEPGACANPDPATGGNCIPQLDGTFLASDRPGDPTVFAYGDGFEVAIGGSPQTGAEAGLTIDQLAVAARAVLGALG